MPAVLSLAFHSSGHKTLLRVTKQEPPWRAIRAFANASGEALVHLNNVSGGILGGDLLQLDVNVAADAQAQVTSVGSTRIYRRKPGGEPSRQTSCFHVGVGAYLEYLPDSVIPFRGSAFQQTTEFHLADGAGLIAWEVLAAGRLAYGECDAFESFGSRAAIHGPNGPLALENYLLRPAERSLRSAARMGRFHYAATMWICRIDDNAMQWMKLEQQLNEVNASGCWGASALHQHGLVVRGLVDQAHQASAGLQMLWQIAKQQIWQRPAIPPRKVY